jgi:hypothetical protein
VDGQTRKIWGAGGRRREEVLPARLLELNSNLGTLIPVILKNCVKEKVPVL